MFVLWRKSICAVSLASYTKKKSCCRLQPKLFLRIIGELLFPQLGRRLPELPLAIGCEMPRRAEAAIERDFIKRLVRFTDSLEKLFGFFTLHPLVGTFGKAGLKFPGKRSFRTAIQIGELFYCFYMIIIFQNEFLKAVVLIECGDKKSIQLFFLCRIPAVRAVIPPV